MASLLGRAIPLWNRMFPKASGPRGLKYSFPLDVNTSYQVSIQLTDVGLDFINGVFIDNSLNPAGFTLFNGVTGQNIFVPAFSQADFALNTAQSTDSIAFVGSSTGGVQVPVLFKNTEPQGNTIWSSVAAGTIIGAVTVQGSVTALSYVSAGIEAVNQSVIVGGTSQSLFAANPARKGILIANPASGPSQGLGAVAPESLFIRLGAAASGAGVAGNIEIAPGGFYNPLTAIDNRAINIIGATTGHVFAAIQYQ